MAIKNLVISDNGQLACPTCSTAKSRYDYSRDSLIHQDIVQVFTGITPEEGYDMEHQVVIDGAEVNDGYVPNSMANPAQGGARRSAIRISFWCEHCTVDKDLLIYQYKGATYIEWSDEYMLPRGPYDDKG